MGPSDPIGRYNTDGGWEGIGHRPPGLPEPSRRRRPRQSSNFVHTPAPIQPSLAPVRLELRCIVKPFYEGGKELLRVLPSLRFDLGSLGCGP